MSYTTFFILEGHFSPLAPPSKSKRGGRPKRDFSAVVAPETEGVQGACELEKIFLQIFLDRSKHSFLEF